MRLHKAAVRFDDSVLHDAYTNTLVGKGQLDPTDIFKLDGASVRRRVISVAPDTVLPTRRAVRLGADVYLIGEPSVDEWKGSPIRTKYVLHQTPSTATFKTFAEALANQPGRVMYASREWNKDVPDLKESSDYFNDYHIFVANTEDVATYDLVWVDNQWHICHAIHPSLSGFTDAVSHEILGTVFETITVSDKAYNPVTDNYTSVNTTNVKVLRLRWQEQYEYLRESQEDYARGDETLVVLDSVGGWLPTPSDTVALSDGRWRVLSARAGDGVWLVHIRRD